MLDTDPKLAAIAGLVHGFTDREGGVSTGRYATLNMASKWGDDSEAVDENRRRVAETHVTPVGRPVTTVDEAGKLVAELF